MKFTSPFSADFWISYEHEPPKSNVVQFPAVARANAAQAAESLEQDRSNMRADLRNDLYLQRNRLIDEIARIDAALAELAGA